MPTYNMVCGVCETSEKRVRDFRWSKATPEQLKEIRTCKCGGEMKRLPNPPPVSTKETLDNGIMRRAVERFSNAQEMYTERADDHTKMTKS